MCDRCDNDVEFFHDIERVSVHIASCVESNCNERVGRCMHVFHLRLAAGICMRQLRRKEETIAQRSLPTRRKPSHSGKTSDYLSRFCCLDVPYNNNGYS